MKAKILLVILIFLSQLSYAQSESDRAKAYYFEAVNSFESKNYDKTLEYCQQVEDILKTSNARVEALRVKSYFAKGNMEKAKEALNRFSNYGADENLSAEVSPYIVKIEEKEEYERTHTTCWKCNGTGYDEEEITCWNCDGKGRESYTETCSECNGRGGKNVNHGWAVGTKWHKCWACGGNGQGSTKYRDCSKCNGNGYSDTRTITCKICKGKGDVLKR